MPTEEDPNHPPESAGEEQEPASEPAAAEPTDSQSPADQPTQATDQGPDRSDGDNGDSSPDSGAADTSNLSADSSSSSPAPAQPVERPAFGKNLFAHAFDTPTRDDAATSADETTPPSSGSSDTAPPDTTPADTTPAEVESAATESAVQAPKIPDTPAGALEAKHVGEPPAPVKKHQAPKLKWDPFKPPEPTPAPAAPPEAPSGQPDVPGAEIPAPTAPMSDQPSAEPEPPAAALSAPAAPVAPRPIDPQPEPTAPAAARPAGAPPVAPTPAPPVAPTPAPPVAPTPAPPVDAPPPDEPAAAAPSVPPTAAPPAEAPPDPPAAPGTGVTEPPRRARDVRRAQFSPLTEQPPAPDQAQRAPAPRPPAPRPAAPRPPAASPRPKAPIRQPADTDDQDTALLPRIGRTDPASPTAPPARKATEPPARAPKPTRAPELRRTPTQPTQPTQPTRAPVRRAPAPPVPTQAPETVRPETSTGPRHWPKRLAWTLIPLVLVIGLATAGIGWYYSNEILTVTRTDAPYDIEVVAVREGVVVLSGDDSDHPQVTGLEWEGGYVRLLAGAEATTEGVLREFEPFPDTPAAGTMARLDLDAAPEDLTTVLDAETITFDAPLGQLAATYVPGESSRWVIFVHGRGASQAETFRLLPLVAGLGHHALAISYRNDIGAPPDPNGWWGMGWTESQDLAAAVAHARTNGASEVVLVGYSMGAAIVGNYLRTVGDDGVAGVIYDSPLLSWTDTINAEAADRGLPSFLTGLASTAVRVRAGIDLDELDQVAHADRLSVPLLLIHGSGDETVPVAGSDEFAQARPDLVTYLRLDGAGHVQGWNTHQRLYEDAVETFLSELE